MPEVGDHHRGAEILIPRGGKMAQGQVMAWSDDASGNLMGRAHMNATLDTMIYQVEFTGGKIIRLFNNIIAESMYACK